ncbi:MAG: bacterioferritin-associated ferredoxin [Candidatus Pelagisphaera sp.]|jgi:bacterioferritin-associated ferredoxin
MNNRLRAFLFITLLIPITYGAEDQTPPKHLSPSDLIKGAVVKASCGQCNFEMEGNGCDLAVAINGKTYFVTDSHIDDHGDAHSSHGFCNAIRDAMVKGTIKNGKFHAKEFVLLESVK